MSCGELSTTGLSDNNAQLTQENECVAYAVVPRREKSVENELVAYSVTEVPAPPNQPRPDKGKEKIHTTSASTEHVYCLIKEPAVKRDGDKTEIQEVEIHPSIFGKGAANRIQMETDPCQGKCVL
ncbi:uncharacterized protein [Chiloscyllium punctatum]|uniref:uncharacterized protein isoform X3 n=1 Tax=Chiloscyllium punctatum TaxID=137246 RepID=UPI003B631B16